jgi:hypothetical protein
MIIYLDVPQRTTCVSLHSFHPDVVARAGAPARSAAGGSRGGTRALLMDNDSFRRRHRGLERGFVGGRGAHRDSGWCECLEGVNKP